MFCCSFRHKCVSKSGKPRQYLPNQDEYCQIWRQTPHSLSLYDQETLSTESPAPHMDFQPKPYINMKLYNSSAKHKMNKSTFTIVKFGSQSSPGRSISNF